MKDIQELLEQVKKKAKDKDAGYMYGVEYSSHTKPGFKAVVRFSKNIQPVVFAASSRAQLKRAIQQYLDGAETKDVNIRYFEEQIDLEKKAIRFFEDQIADYKSGKTPEL